MDEWSLSDVCRIRNPTGRGYTFRRGSYSSRLDFFLISSHLTDSETNSKVDIIVQSDHAMVTLSVLPGRATRGLGFWRFDTSLLEREDFLTEMTEFLTEWIPPSELTNPSSIWEWLKFQIQN